jgi:hypothetical protein
MGIEKIEGVKEISCDYATKLCTFELETGFRRIGPIHSTWYEGDIYTVGQDEKRSEVKYRTPAYCSYDTLTDALSCKSKKI